MTLQLGYMRVSGVTRVNGGDEHGRWERSYSARSYISPVIMREEDSFWLTRKRRKRWLRRGRAGPARSQLSEDVPARTMYDAW